MVNEGMRKKISCQTMLSLVSARMQISGNYFTCVCTCSRGPPDNHCIFAEILICDTIPRDIIGHVQYAKLHCRLVFLCFRTKPMAAPVLQPLLLVETKTDSRCSVTVADGNKNMAWSHCSTIRIMEHENFKLNQALSERAARFTWWGPRLHQFKYELVNKFRLQI